MSNEILELILANRKKNIGQLEPSLFVRISRFIQENSDFTTQLSRIEKMSLDDLVEERVGRTRRVKIKALEKETDSPFFIPPLRDFGLAKCTYEKVKDLPCIDLCFDPEDVYASLMFGKIPSEHVNFNGFRDKCKVSSLIDYALLKVKLDREQELLKSQKQARDVAKERKDENIRINIQTDLTDAYGSITGALDISFEDETFEQNILDYFNRRALPIRSHYQTLAVEESSILAEELRTLSAVRRKNFEVGDNVRTTIKRGSYIDLISGDVSMVKSYFWGLLKRVHIQTPTELVKSFSWRVTKKVTPVLGSLLEKEHDKKHPDYQTIETTLPTAVRELYLGKIFTDSTLNQRFVREVVAETYQENIRAMIGRTLENYKENIEDYTRTVSNTNRRIRRIESCLKTFEKEVAKKTS